MAASSSKKEKRKRHSFSSSFAASTSPMGGESPASIAAGNSGSSSSNNNSNNNRIHQQRKAAKTSLTAYEHVSHEEERTVNESGYGGESASRERSGSRKDSGSGGSGGRSLMGRLRLKKKKKFQQNSKLCDTKTTGDENFEQNSKPGGDFVRVIISELRPETNYKTLKITHYTTAYEVIVKIIQKFAVSEADKDPDLFYLTEVKENEQGRYSRLLKNSDQLYEIQSKWEHNTDCFFALCRQQSEVLTGPNSTVTALKQEEQPKLRAMIMSPSQDSFYNGFPGYSQAELDDEAFSPTSNPLSSISPPLVSPINPPPSSHTSSTTTFQGISSRLKSSKLIAEDENPLPNPPQGALGEFKPRAKHGHFKHTSFSDSNIGTIMEMEAETESPDEPLQVFTACKEEEDEKTREKERENQRRVTQRQLIQKSISKGMQDIMAKVVSETKQSSPLAKKPHSHVRSHTAPSNVPVAATTESDLQPPKWMPRGNIDRNVHVRQLICSPMTSVTDIKKYPNFVFTPSSSQDHKVQSQKGTSDSHEMRSLIGGLSPNDKLSHDYENDWYEDSTDEKYTPTNFKEYMADEDEDWLGRRGSVGEEREVSNSHSSREKIDSEPNQGTRKESPLMETLCSSIVGQLAYEDSVLGVDSTEGDTTLQSINDGEIHSSGSSEDKDITGDEEEDSDQLSTSRPSVKEENRFREEDSWERVKPVNRRKILCSLPHHHSTKSLPADAPETPPPFHSEMELVKPLSALLYNKIATNSTTSSSISTLQTSSLQPQAFAMKSSVSTNDLSKKQTEDTRPSSSLGLGLRRSATDVPVGEVKRTSVTKLKRPHSFHFSKYLPRSSTRVAAAAVTASNGTGVVDFTKDEFIRRAALQGMTRKPKSRRSSQDDPISPAPHSTIPAAPSSPLKAKEVVTDLDILVQQQKTSQRNAGVCASEGRGTGKTAAGEMYRSASDNTSRSTVKWGATKFMSPHSDGVFAGSVSGEGEEEEKEDRVITDQPEKKSLRPQSAPVTAEAAYIIQYEPEKLCWTQF